MITRIEGKLRLKVLWFVNLFLTGLLFLGPSGHLSAGPAILFDADNGKVLYAEDPDMLWHPASLTKLMTAYLVFDALKAGEVTMETEIVSSPNAHSQPPSKIGLPIGGKMSVDQGLRSLIVKSANDVAVMLAEAVSGTEEEFVQRMNETAKRLGMRHSKFYNPNGLPDARQVVTARDMAILSQAILRDYPQYNDLFALAKMKIGKIHLRSHNDMLRTFEGADGMKTGFICASGYNIVASATREQRKLIAVVLGAKTPGLRRQRTSDLLEHGFQNYKWKSLLFEAPVIGTLAESPDIKGPTNMRRFVRSYACGYRSPTPKKQRVRKVKKRKRKNKSS